MLTPLYDSFSRAVFGKAYKKIANFIDPQPGMRILDVGCGTGNMIIELKKKCPAALVSGLDIDPEILKIAKQKFEKIGIEAPLINASADQLPGNSHFSVVTSNMMFHHMPTGVKKKALERIHKVLKENGRFYLFDFAAPRTLLGKIIGKVFRYAEEVADAVDGKYPLFMKEAGFKNVRQIMRYGPTAVLVGNK